MSWTPAWPAVAPNTGAKSDATDPVELVTTPRGGVAAPALLLCRTVSQLNRLLNSTGAVLRSRNDRLGILAACGRGGKRPIGAKLSLGKKTSRETRRTSRSRTPR